MHAEIQEYIHHSTVFKHCKKFTFLTSDYNLIIFCTGEAVVSIVCAPIYLRVHRKCDISCAT